MAAALRFAARKICSRALQRPQAFFTTAAEAAVKEGRRRLLPKINHGGSSVRRFTTAESSTLIINNSNKVISNTAQPAEGLAKQIESKKHELLNLLGRMEAESCMAAEHKELQQVLQVNNNRSLGEAYRRSMFTGMGTVLAGFATAIVGTKVIVWRYRD